MGISFHRMLGPSEYRFSSDSLHFDNQGITALEHQLSKEEVFQTRIKLALIIVTLIFFAAGCTACGLAFAVIIPYGLFHTCTIAVGASVLTLSFMVAVVLCNDSTNRITAFLTNRSFFHELKREILPAPSSVRIIYCKKSWAYLSKCHREYNRYLLERKKEMQKILDEQFLHDQPKNPITNQPLYTFIPLVDVIESYL